MLSDIVEQICSRLLVDKMQLNGDRCRSVSSAAASRTSSCLHLLSHSSVVNDASATHDNERIEFLTTGPGHEKLNT